MFFNFLKIALRKLRGNKTFSLINILGLTIGTASCLYILLFVLEHRGYDKHHHGAENIFRITSDLFLPNQQDDMYLATCSPPIAPGMQSDFPEVESAARVCIPPGVDQFVLRLGDRVFYEKQGYYVDSTFFRILDYHFVEGSSDHALDAPFSVVISQELSTRLFGDQSAVGQSVAIGGGGPEEQFQITGVYDGALGKSHLMPGLFMTMNSAGIGQYVRNNDSWAGNNFIYAYLRLKPGTDPHVLESKIPDFLTRHGSAQLAQLGMRKVLHLQPVTEIHTSTTLIADIPTNTSARFLNILLLIAGFIQLVACINFMNLTTARSAQRAREVGVRKVVGASRQSMAGQFLGESILLTLISMGLAVPLVHVILPWLNSVTGADVALHFEWELVSVILVLVVLTGILAGSYPAFYLSGFKPVHALHSNTPGRGVKNAVWLRKGLVISQFAISIALVFCALIIRFQLDYIHHKDLGFDKHHKLVLPFRTSEGQESIERFRNGLLQLPEVHSASAVAAYPGQTLVNDVPLYPPGADMNQATDIRFTYTDENYLKTLKIGLLSGRDFVTSDTSLHETEGKAILNLTALKRLGVSPEEAPGTVLKSEFEDQRIEITIVGVMQDFLYQNLSAEMDPFMVIYEVPRHLSNIIADVQTQDYVAFLPKVEELWNRLIPGLPFEYSFLDENIAETYHVKQVLSRIIALFTVIAILISCLGLFGLSAFTAEQRAKEIGIRKVLGSSTTGIVGLLSRDFLKLVCIALLVASPVGYYVMRQWLSDFAYRMTIEWWMFLLTGLVALVVAFVTISFQSIRAALGNPVTSLRSE